VKIGQQLQERSNVDLTPKLRGNPALHFFRALSAFSPPSFQAFITFEHSRLRPFFFFSLPAFRPNSFLSFRPRALHLWPFSFTITTLILLQFYTESLLYYVMEFEWDENKSRVNNSKHGIDFNTATGLWNDQDRIEIQTNFPSENRNALIGKIEDKLWTAIFTRRVYAIRIISVRRARKKETELYERK